MGIVDVVKKAPFLFYAIHTIIHRVLHSHPSAVLCIDQPSLSMAIAKRLRHRGYTGKIIQVVAPTVWAYKPERIDTMAQYFDLVLPLFRFEVDLFHKKLPAIWVGHPASSLRAPNTTSLEKKTTLALFPGSRPGEIRRNLPLQLQAAALLLKHHPELTPAISVSNESKKMITQSAKKMLGNRCEFVEFADRYRLMERSAAAIAKSGTVTLELALLNVPTVCCYQTGAFTQWWARTILKLSPRFFALPNILTGQEIFPECIIPPVTPERLCDAIEPYIKGEKSLPDGLQEQLRFQIDAKGEVGALIAQAVEAAVRDRPGITFPVIEEKNGSDLDDFSEEVSVDTSEEKSSRDESIFPSRTGKGIPGRSLRRKS
jgi:lipid-A-disaccharide synthase